MCKLSAILIDIQSKDQLLTAEYLVDYWTICLSMDEKRSSGRSKRQKPIDEGSWDCSVCTFKNPVEAYKCEMCDVRKGTSTRKPRLNAQIAAQQVAQQYIPPPPKKEKSGTVNVRTESLLLNSVNDSSNDSYDTHINTQVNNEKDDLDTSSNTVVEDSEKNHTNSSSTPVSKKSRTPKLRNVDRSSAQTMAVTVGSVTVVITDYKPKKEHKAFSTDFHNNIMSDSSDHSSSQSPLNGHTKDITEQRTN